MRSILALARKDMQRVVSILVFSIIIEIIFFISYHLFLGQGMSYLISIPEFSLTFFLLIAYLLGNTLASKEHYEGTQSFVEALPIPRRQPVLVKYFCGLALLLILITAYLVLAFYLTAQSEPVDSDFFILLWIRSAVYVFSLWGFMLLINHLGRLRIPLLITLILIVITLDSSTSFEFARFGPAMLMVSAN